MSNRLNDYPIEEGAGMRIARCYRCGKGDMVDMRGICLTCYKELTQTWLRTISEICEKGEGG